MPTLSHEPPPTATFEVVDESRERTDLAARRELKFVFESQDAAGLRAALLQTAKPIVYAGRVSKVRSIYFDDPALAAARANLAGIGQRHKTRLRWYDAEAPGTRVFLEIKWREHGLTGKHRCELRASRPVSEMGYGELVGALRRDAPERYGARLAADVDPVCMVEYSREHFLSPDGSTRMTLDHDIRFYPQLGRRGYGRRFPERLTGLVLLEVKSRPDQPPHLPALLSRFPVRATRFSKYVTGCQRLGFLSEG